MSEEMKKRIFYLLVYVLAALIISCCTPELALDKLPWIDVGQIVFQDDFSDRSTGWEKVNTPYELKGYSDGGYLISVKMESARSWSVANFPTQDIEISVQTQKISGPNDTNFGILCRYQDKDNYYSFLISSDGYYGILKMQDGIDSLLGNAEFTFSSDILREDGINQIAAECLGNELNLKVNGQKLLSVVDDAFQVGKVGLIVETGAEGTAAIVFKDFSVIKR